MRTPSATIDVDQKATTDHSEPAAADPRWTGRFFAARDRWERLGKIYVSLVVAAGVAFIAWASVRLLTETAPPQWILLAAATILAGGFTVRARSLHATISISDVCILTLVVVFGAPPAIVAVALDGLLTSSRTSQRTRYRTAFNIAEPTVSVAVAAAVYATLSGLRALGDAGALWAVVAPVLGLITTYLLLNAVLSATAIRFETHLPVRQVVRAVAPYLGLNAILCLGVLTLIVQQVRIGHLPNLQVLALAGVALMLTYVITKVFFAELDAARRLGRVVLT